MVGTGPKTLSLLLVERMARWNFRRISQNSPTQMATQTTTENGIMRNAEGRIIAFTPEFYSTEESNDADYDQDEEEDPALPKDVGSEVEAVEEPGLVSVESKKVVKFKFKRAPRKSKPSSFRSDEEPSHVD